MMSNIFNAVYNILQYLSNVFKIHYNIVNVIVYYLFIPLSWLVIIDFKFETFFSILYFVIVCMWTYYNRKNLEYKLHKVFYGSVKFLLSFKFMNYTQSSVVICVIIPIIVYVVVIYI